MEKSSSRDRDQEKSERATGVEFASAALAHSALTPAPGQPLIILDTETTGLDHKSEKLIEIAAVKMVDGEITETFSSLVNPQKTIRRSSFMIHGISDEQVEGAPLIDEVLPQFLEFVGDLSFVAHNAIFDYSFINEACKSVNGERFQNHRIDTFEMYRSVFPDEPSHGLSALLARFGFDPQVKHRALDDAMCLAKVYPRLQMLYSQKYAWQLSQLPNIDYLLERYLRLQKAIQSMQSEMSDLKEVFKLHFQQGGKPVHSSFGETMISSYRRSYAYDDAKVWALALEAGIQERLFKLNPRAADKLLDGDRLPTEQRDQLLEARINMHESKQVSFIRTQTLAVETKESEEESTEEATEASG